MTSNNDNPTEQGSSQDTSDPSLRPTQIGAYRIVDLLGVGGMAEVYLAEQTEPVKRQVALKILKPGMDSNQIVARFESERQALALLDHPNIAKIFDGGLTEAARPYFVMEWVKGLPVTEYCDAYRLSVEDRLRLFVNICSAVQHAHNKGLIHRDLKPSNILVGEADGKPLPKIIDFGIAKVTGGTLTDKTVHTRIGQVIGTPKYMSPEQADSTGLDVDTRSDIYSLGVVLYEMLVGVVPVDPVAAGTSMRSALFETDASKPSTRVTELGDDGASVARARSTSPQALRRELKGDLDWVVMKAIATDRARRYATPDALAMDCARYLKHQPVLARPPSAGYLLQRFVRRNRLAFAAFCLLFVAMIVAVVGTSWGMLRALHAEQRAAEESDIARAVNEFLNADLLAAVAPSTRRGRGKDVPMREVLDVAAQRIEEASAPGGRFADAPRVEAAIRTTLGKTYKSLGEFAAAEPHLTRALRLFEQHPGEGQRELALALGEMGDLSSSMGRYDHAEQFYQDALDTWSRSPGEENQTTLRWMAAQARIFGRQGRANDAEQLLLRTLRVTRERFSDDSPLLLKPMSTLANLYQELGENDKAEAVHLEALGIQERHEGPDSIAMMQTMNNLANVYGSQGRFDEAQPLWARSLELKRRVLGDEHPSTLNTLANMAETREILGDYARAGEMFREVIDARTRTLGPEHPRTLRSRARLAFVTARLGRLADAEAQAMDVSSLLRTTLGPDHPYALETDDIMATILALQGRYREAERILRRVRATLERLYPDDTFNRNLTSAHLGLVLANLGMRGEAETLWNEAVANLSPGHAESLLIQRAVVDFLEQWHREQPNEGFGARADEWRKRLAQIDGQVDDT